MEFLQLVDPRALVIALATALLLFLLNVLANWFDKPPHWMTPKRLVMCSLVAIITYAVFTTAFPIDGKKRSGEQDQASDGGGTTSVTAAPLTPTTEPPATTPPPQETTEELPPIIRTTPPRQQDRHLPEPPVSAGRDNGAVATSGPQLLLDHTAVQQGGAFTISGSGFNPKSAITFQFESSAGIWYQLPGFAVTDAAGTFREQSTADLQFCDDAGGVIAFYGRSDLARDANGHLNSPVTGTPLIITC